MTDTVPDTAMPAEIAKLSDEQIAALSLIKHMADFATTYGVGSLLDLLRGEGLIGEPLEPLGREFEVIWDQNTSILYEE